MATLALVALEIAAFAATPEELAARSAVQRLEFSEKRADELTDRNLGQAGQVALGIEPDKWRHAESDHFVIHYQVWEVGRRLLREAEFYYWKIQHDLHLTKDLASHKSHLFLFQDDDHWRAFQARTGLSNIAGVTIGNEFFAYYPKKKDKDFSGTVAHEMTHLVFNRFFTGSPPLWLNEGFAEYQAHNAYRSLYGKRLGATKKDTRMVGQVDFLDMTKWTAYSRQQGINQAFYVKSMLAVDLLVDKGGPERFVGFINTMIQNPDFNAAFNQHYQKVFRDTDQFTRELARKEKRL